MKFMTRADAHRRPVGYIGTYAVIEFNTARAERWERVDDANRVSPQEAWLMIEPTDKTSARPIRAFPLHMIAEITRYPEVEAP